MAGHTPPFGDDGLKPVHYLDIEGQGALGDKYRTGRDIIKLLVSVQHEEAASGQP